MKVIQIERRHKRNYNNGVKDVFQAIIFDYDGTLADTKDVIVKAMQQTLSEIGCSIESKFIERHIGIGAKSVFLKALEKCGMKHNDTLMEKLMKRGTAIYNNFIEGEIHFEGTVDLLEELRGKLRIALATMNTRKGIEKSLQRSGLRKYFEVVLSADDVINPKPDPEIFLKCTEKLRLKPEDCVVVEDSIFGVKAARRAGIECIAVMTGSYNPDELKNEGASLIVESVNSKEEIFNFLFSKHV